MPIHTEAELAKGNVRALGKLRTRRENNGA
jgi:hypothetical protein